MLTAAFLVGLCGIFYYSIPAAGSYLVGIIAVFLIFNYAFSAKCPIRNDCTNIVMGMAVHPGVFPL